MRCGEPCSSEYVLPRQFEVVKQQKQAKVDEWHALFLEVH